LDAVHGEKAGFIGAFTRLKAELTKGDSGQIRDGENSGAGVSVYRGKGIELLQMDVLYSGLLANSARGRFVSGLLHSQKAAGNGPFSNKRMLFALDEKQLELSILYGKEQDIDRHGRMLELRRIIL
jgi:hypothetical protein